MNGVRSITTCATRPSRFLSGARGGGKKLTVNWLSDVYLVEGVETEVMAMAVC